MNELEKYLEENFEKEANFYPRYSLGGKKPDWRVVMERSESGYSLVAWKCDVRGKIIKRCQASYIKTKHEFDVLLNFTEICLK